MVKKLGLVVLALVVLVVTPYWWLSDPFEFGEAEVRAAVEGRWRLTTPSGTVDLTLEVQGAETRAGGWVRSAAACHSRTLVRSASACATVTRVPLVVTQASGEPASGELNILDLEFRYGQLMLELGGLLITATLSPAGEAQMTGALEGRSTLVRVDSPDGTHGARHRR